MRIWEIGFEQGYAEGVEEGAERNRRENVVSFYRNGVSVDVIAKSLELPVDEVLAILKDAGLKAD